MPISNDGEQSDSKHKPDDHPPEGAAYFVVYHKEIIVGDREERVAYEPGDEIPPTFAHDLWSAFGDHIAAFAPHGGRLDEPVRGDADKDTSALAEWRADRGDDGPPYTCKSCGKEFLTAAAWQGHQATHAASTRNMSTTLDGPPYVCETCGRVFDTESAYHGHQAAHVDDIDGSDIDHNDALGSTSRSSPSRH